MSKWINCKKCGHEYNNSLSRCPNCSAITISLKTYITAFTTILFAAIIVIGIVLGFKDEADIKPTSSKPAISSSKESSSKKDSSSSSGVLSSDEKASSTENQSSNPSKPKPSVFEAPKIGSAENNGIHYTTLPKYYLEYWYEMNRAVTGDTTSFNDFAYKFTDKEKNYGFTEKIKNSDGSVTYKMPKSKFTKHLADKLCALIDLQALLKKEEYINDIDANGTAYENITVTVNKDTLNAAEKANIVIFGLSAFDKRLFSISNNKCTLSIKYPNQNVEILKLPDDIKK